MKKAITQFRGGYSWLSNFAKCNIKLRKQLYSSVERAYISEKNKTQGWKIICANDNISIKDIKKISRTIEIREDWDEVKIEVMKYCLKQKFSQEYFVNMLLSTENKQLFNGNYFGDKFWGVCLKTNEGKNNLGKLIMGIRTELQKK